MENWFRGTSEKSSIYCNFKYPRSHEHSSYFGKYQIPNHVKTEHMGITLTECQLALIEEALHDIENKWFIILSGGCLPTKPFQELYDFLKFEKLSLFDTTTKPLPHTSNPEFLESWIGEWNTQTMNYNLSTFKKHIQWCVLNRQDAETLARTKNKHLPAWHDLQNKYNRRFEKSELYPIAVLKHENENYQWTEQAMFHMNWPPERTGPLTYDVVDSSVLQHCPLAYFIRKINTQTIVNL